MKKEMKKKKTNLFGGSGLVRCTLQNVMLNAGRCANGRWIWNIWETYAMSKKPDFFLNDIKTREFLILTLE